MTTSRGEAIRLGRLLAELLPNAEVFGLLALMLLRESRRKEISFRAACRLEYNVESIGW